MVRNSLTVIHPWHDALSKCPKILLVDDDAATLSLLKRTVESAGVQVLWATSGPQALRLTFEHRPDIILLDIDRPDINGVMICQRLRELSETPFIVVSSHGKSDQVIRALACGANDYLAKPFSGPDLLAKLQSRLERMPAPNGADDRIVLGNGDLIIDAASRYVWVRQYEVRLSRAEYDLLVCLARNPGRVLAYDTLTEAIAGQQFSDRRASLKQIIARLRKKIEVNPRLPQWLISRRGVGYSLLID